MKKLKLSDVSQIIMGQSPKGASYNKKGVGLPLLNGAADYKGQIFNPNQYTSEPTRITVKGDIIFGVRATIGNFAISDGQYCIGRGVSALRVNEELVDKMYLLRLLKGKIYKLKHSAAGSTIKGIKKSDLANMSITLPPLSTQKRIAQILDNAAALRDKTQQLLDEYDQLAQSIFLDMFGDPVVNPKGWEEKKLGDFGIWQSGGTPSRKIVEYFNGDIPWLSSGELNEIYIENSIEHITEKAIEDSSAKLIPKGSLLLGMYDTAALKSTINLIELTCNQAIAFGVLNSDLLNTVYAYSIIQIGREHYRRLQRGARQKNLNLSMVKSIKIMYPPIHLQNQFAEKIGLIEQQKAIAKQELAASEDLFNGLLQKAFKGELS